VVAGTGRSVWLATVGGGAGRGPAAWNGGGCEHAGSGHQKPRFYSHRRLWPALLLPNSLRAPTLLPQAVALEVQPPVGWKATVLLESQSRSWTETDPLDGTLQFDPNSTERVGPLTMGVALFRPRLGLPAADDPPTLKEQRIVVIGDGDFLSNTYLGNGANLELGLNIIHWLTLDDTLIRIPPRMAPDPNLNLSEAALALIAAVFLIGLPVGLLASGWLIWFRRQRR
jgi:hypothetical protein